MVDIFKRKLNSSFVLEESLPLFVEAFVRYYGEDEREEIVNKFNNMLTVSYRDPKDISSLLYEIDKEKTTQLIDSIFEKAQIPEDKREFLKKTLFSDFSFVYDSLFPIYNYVSYINGERVSSWDKSRVVKTISEIYPDVTVDNLDEKIEKGEFSIVDRIVPFYKTALLEFKEFKSELNPYSEYVDKCKLLMEELDRKYMLKCVKEFKNIFPSIDFEEIEKMILSGSYKNIPNPIIKNYIGNRISFTPLIDAFSDESDELLLNGKDWQKNNIKLDRISFYKNLGLNLGDDFSLYEDDARALELTPSKEVVNLVLDTKKRMYTEEMNEYYTSIPEYLQNKEKMNACGLVDITDLCSPNDYVNHRTYISPRFVQKDEQYVLYPALCLYCGTNGGELDHNIVHELNHIYEINLLHLSGNNYRVIAGWDVIDGVVIEDEKKEMMSLEKDEQKRSYELFNEIINELIAQDICRIMIDMGSYVFTDKETNKTVGSTSYEHTLFLVNEFYNTYKSEILQSRKNGDMSILFSTVGKENFDALNSLFHEFYENFNGFGVYKLYSELRNGEVTEKTTKYASLIEKRNSILKNMHEVSLENKNIK